MRSELITCIETSDFSKAMQLLEENTENLQEKYLLSLLYRYFNKYEQEKLFLDQLTEASEYEPYVNERLKWHALPYDAKLVPRPQIFIEDKQAWRDKFVEKTAIVIGCDSNLTYVRLLFELLESLKCLPTFSNIDIHFLDCGLREDHLYAIKSQFNIKSFVKPEQKFQVNNGNIHIEMLSRPFLAEIFPGYEYYLHLDSDIWIQDEHVFDKYFLLAEKQGIGIARHFKNDIFLGSLLCDQDNIAPLLWSPEAFEKTPWCNAGVFCIKKDSHYFDAYRKALKINLKDCKSITGLTEQLSLNCVIAKELQLEILDPIYNFIGYFNPSLQKDQQLLILDDQPIGIMHLAGPKRANASVVSCIADIYDIKSHKKEPISLLFKILPWADKEEIKGMINRCIKT